MPVTKKTKKPAKKTAAKKSKVKKSAKKTVKKPVAKALKKLVKKVKRVSDSPPVVDTFVKQEVVEAVVDSSGVVTMVPVVTK